ncbi:UDP-3-O-(3-hydroxymyristoyl)glucosamine N-acyltransferase [Fibrella aquatica]|jgi:UDP-3-O-[3-hydroxymyristoyl] glucosamine N-acyltransferase|uniref:UDP-3-O-(3-hydroxymyristoyl)glucosamine N-acyltransferase n=1 Tax=Fibrella aquatica TaxID=3242487 RepID=UPI0035219CFF
MEFTVRQIAALLNGDISGNDTLKVSQLSKIEEATPGCISFLSNLKYEPFLYTTQASAVIVDRSFEPREAVSTTLIKVENAYLAFTQLLEEYHRQISFARVGIEQPSFVHESSCMGEGVYLGAFAYVGKQCKIGKNVKIYPHTYIGDNVTIGDNSIIHSGAKLIDNTVVGKHCIIHPNAVIGSDGFGFAPQADGTYKTIPQLGNVVLEDNVSVGSNTTIDCATMGSTIIRQGAKLDNLIQIGHNVEIGRNTVIAAQTGISGSTRIGDNCVIAGQVGFAGHLTIANGTKVGAQSGVGKNITEEGISLNGSHAFLMRDNMRSQAIFRRLPELERRVSDLEKKI